MAKHSGDGSNGEQSEVELRRYGNALDAEMALQFLREHDIKARLSGFGETGFIQRFTSVDLRLMVHKRDLPAAREALSAMEMPEDAVNERFLGQDSNDVSATNVAGPYRESRAKNKGLNRDEDGQLPDQRNRVGAMTGFFIPGGGHIYARRPWTGLVFFVFVIVGLTVATSLNLRWLGMAAMMVICYDVLHSLLAIEQHNQGNDPGRRSQLAHGALAVCIATGAGIAINLVRPVTAAMAPDTQSPATP